MTIHACTERTIFLEAIEKPSETERNAFVEGACLDNPQLQEAVRALLRAHQESGDLLDAPAAILPTIDQPTEHIGTLVERYKLLEQVGEGGMGIVFVAEQTEPVRRRVALKIIKPGMDTKQVIARFEAERQALAMMDHPNIARVLDAGTTEAGRPYFVMELVRGMPITEYCDQARLSPRQRLELFVDVCQAVQHAHQKGVIHRDLKPSNVMVAMNDGRPVVKVIDFGVAKAVGQQLTERTIYTALTQLVGTPLYMSPEQAELTTNDVDTRSDVYSLGVLLYELLTGQTPFDKETLASAGLDEMRRIIREDEPLRPSRRFSTLGAQAISTISQRRSLDERRLSKILCGELDWIVMKALEKDRSRRYETASSLTTDIQRYLSDEPVLACPPTAMYRFQKFARKHKPALATAAAIALCLILGTTVSAWQAVRATTAEAQANANERKAAANEQKAAANEQKAVANAATALEKEQEAIKQRDEVKALADKLAAKDQQLQRTLYAAHMNLAHNAFEAGAPGRLRELLAQHRPQPGEADLRGFEWHYLNRLFPADLLVLKHPGHVHSVAYSPDGKRLATTSSLSGNGILRVWDAQTGEMAFSTKAAPSTGHATFSPDGKRVATEGKIWDAETGHELLSLSTEAEPATRAVYSPDGKYLATTLATGSGGSREQKIAIWDAQTGQRLLTLEGHGRPRLWPYIFALAFSPDGKRLASASSDKTLKLWDAETGQLLHTLEGHTDTVCRMAYSLDGKRLASASFDKTVKLWNALSGEEICTLRGHTGKVFGVAFSPDGKRLASASEDTTVKVWDVEAGDELSSLKGHTGVVTSVVFSPDGQRLASGSHDGTVKVREAKAVQKALVLGGGPANVTQVAFSPDGKRLTSVYTGNGPYLRDEPKVWDTQTGEKLLDVSVLQPGPRSVALSLDGRRLASWSVKVDDSGRTLQIETNIWNLLTGEKLLTIPKARNARFISLSPDGSRLVVTGDSRFPFQNKSIAPPSRWLFDANTGDEIRSWNDPVANMVFSPDGKRLLGTAEDGTLKLWDARTGDETLTLKGTAGGAVFSPDGKRLAAHSGARSLELWDAQTGDEVLTITGAAGARVFSHDGKRLATGSDDPTVVKLWNAQTGKELLSLKGHSGAITGFVFSPDDKRLVTTSTDATIKVWDTQAGQELLTLAGHGGRENLLPPRGAFDSGRGNSVAFSPDGHRLAAGGPNGTVMIYDATPQPEKP